MKVTRGKKHNYLSIILYYHSQDKLKIDMEYYINNMVQKFLEELSGKGKALQNSTLLKVSTKSLTLDIEKAESFHSFIIKRMFLAKRARPDLKPSFAFLLTQVKGLTEED